MARMCMLSKDICPICNKNKDGFCSTVEKPVSEIMKQWESAQRSKARRKLKENDYFFSDKRFDKIEELVYKIKKNPMRSKEQIRAINDLKIQFEHWHRIDTEFL